MITEESFIDSTCPYCQEPLSFPQQDAGYVRACPTCLESLIVPVDGSGAGLKLPLPITTARLILRRLAPGDWKSLLGLVSDEELLRHTDLQPMQEEQILHWIESDMQVKLTTPDQIFYLGIELTEKGQLIGFLALNFMDSQRLQVRMDIYLSRDQQKQGFALEAVESVLGFCFEGIKLHRVTAVCESRNTAACRLLERVGLRREGEFLKSKFSVWDNEWVNTAAYGALAEEYLGAGEKKLSAEGKTEL